MSDLAPTPSINSSEPTLSERVVTDAAGRKLTVLEIDVVEQLDLYEVAGANSTNPAWLGTAMMVASVRTINGVPLPFPRSALNVRSALKRLGRAGMDALRADRAAQQDAEEAAAEAAGQAETDGNHHVSLEEN